MTIPAGPPPVPPSVPTPGLASTRYRLGEVVHLSTTVAVGDTPVDPGGIELRVITPAGTTVTVTEPELDHPATGVYEFAYALPVDGVAGNYRWAWITTGLGQGATSGSFDAVDLFAADVLTLADAKKALGKTTRTVDDEEVQRVVDAVNAWIEDETGVVVPRRVTIAVNASGGRLRLRTVPVLQVYSATQGGLPADVSGWKVSKWGTVRPAAGWSLSGGYVVDVEVGRDAGDRAQLFLAARELVQHWWATQTANSPAIGAAGGMDDGTYDPRLGFAVPNRVAQKIERFAKPPGMA